MENKNFGKKMIAMFAIAIVTFITGFVLATSMYTAGFRFNLPKITVEWSTENHDLILIDRCKLDQTASIR